jgi:5-methylcytosine-specific restriction endonuclease McrA
MPACMSRGIWSPGMRAILIFLFRRHQPRHRRTLRTRHQQHHRHPRQGAVRQGAAPDAAAVQPRTVPSRPPHLRLLRARILLAAPDRDHILPVSQGGRDTWMNVVTACRHCNQTKSGRTPGAGAHGTVYAPYVPNKAEYLILCNRNILADQMDFLARHVPSQSRVRAA